MRQDKRSPTPMMMSLDRAEISSMIYAGTNEESSAASFGSIYDGDTHLSSKQEAP